MNQGLLRLILVENGYCGREYVSGVFCCRRWLHGGGCGV